MTKTVRIILRVINAVLQIIIGSKNNEDKQEKETKK